MSHACRSLELVAIVPRAHAPRVQEVLLARRSVITVEGSSPIILTMTTRSNATVIVFE